MSVLLTMQVGPVDWEKFKAATEWGYNQKGLTRLCTKTQGGSQGVLVHKRVSPNQKPSGLISGKIYRAEGDQSKVLVVEEWESHDAWHDYANKFGEEFQSRAGTAGLDWDDTIWVLSDAPQAP